MPDPATDRPDRTDIEKRLSSPLAVGRIGVLGGLTGILCCVGPTVLALIGVVGAGTAFVWANDLYDNYEWWFRFRHLRGPLRAHDLARHLRLNPLTVP